MIKYYKELHEAIKLIQELRRKNYIIIDACKINYLNFYFIPLIFKQFLRMLYILFVIPSIFTI